jgi:hypothetical protein
MAKSIEVQIFDNLVELIKLIDQCKKDKTEEEIKKLDEFVQPILNISASIVDNIRTGE